MSLCVILIPARGLFLCITDPSPHLDSDRHIEDLVSQISVQESQTVCSTQRVTLGLPVHRDGKISPVAISPE